MNTPYHGKIVYIAGAISTDPNYKAKFAAAKAHLLANGAARVLNPAELPDGWTYQEYMAHCMLMVQRAEMIVPLPDWTGSPGAIAEVGYAQACRIPLDYSYPYQLP
jgi:hypothetical protein